MKQELAPRGVGIPVLQGREDVKRIEFTCEGAILEEEDV